MQYKNTNESKILSKVQTAKKWSLLSFCWQAAVEVPQYVGVNLLVEGAHIRRSKPSHRLPAIPNPPHAAPFPPQQPPVSGTTVPTWKTSVNKAAAPFLPSEKENRTVAAVQKASRVRRPRRGRGCMSHSVPRRKSQRLVLVDNSAPLVPWNLSFTLSPPDGAPPHGCQSRLQPPVSHTSRSLPQCAALERKSSNTSTTSTRHQALPSLEVPLPTMQVLSLRPNICRRINFHPWCIQICAQPLPPSSFGLNDVRCNNIQRLYLSYIANERAML